MSWAASVNANDRGGKEELRYLLADFFRNSRQLRSTLHTFSDWDRYAKAEAESENISLLVKSDQALAPAIEDVPVQYLR